MTICALLQGANTCRVLATRGLTKSMTISSLLVGPTLQHASKPLFLQCIRKLMGSLFMSVWFAIHTYCSRHVICQLGMHIITCAAVALLTDTEPC